MGTTERGTMEKDNPYIIICEDNPIISATINIMLQRSGYYNLKVIKSGEELIECTKQKSPSLILLDIALAGELDGVEAIERINQDRSIPYIIITGYKEYLPLIESYNLEPFVILQKPIDLTELLFNVQEAI